VVSLLERINCVLAPQNNQSGSQVAPAALIVTFQCKKSKQTKKHGFVNKNLALSDEKIRQIQSYSKFIRKAKRSSGNTN